MKEETVARFLLRRLKEIGCDHAFGVPGDFILGFLTEMHGSDVQYVGTCNELNAAYAADGYARIKGIGCVCTTFNVGELSSLNGVAGCFSERLPVVAITGVPSRKAMEKKPLLHHCLGSHYLASYSIYEQVTVQQVLLNNETHIVEQIDRALSECLRHQAPVYIALPCDMVKKKIMTPETPFERPSLPQTPPSVLRSAVEDITQLILESKFPLCIPGIEIARRRLQKPFQAFVEAFKIPFATMPMNKAIVDEDHPQFVGLCCGSICRADLKALMGRVDCLIIFGEVLSDFNTGGFSSEFSREKTIEVSYDSLRVKHRCYSLVHIHHLLPALYAALKERGYVNGATYAQGKDTCLHRSSLHYKADDTAPLTVTRFFSRFSTVVQPNSIVLAETGVSSFAAIEVLMPRGVTYISQVYYGSIGYTLGATLGACLAAPERPVYLLIGDGSFQVVCQELSSLIRYQKKASHQQFLPPVIFLINNDGYTIERKIEDGPFNDIQPWSYHALPAAFGAPPGCSIQVKTEGDLEKALSISPKEANLPLLFVELCTDRYDCTRLLELTGEACDRKNRGLLPVERFSAFIDE